MNISVHLDKRNRRFLENVSKSDKARVDRVVQVFTRNGFSTSQLYLKKLRGDIWELRAGRIRLLFGVVENQAIVVHTFVKKTDKTPLRELRLAEQRMKEYA